MIKENEAVLISQLIEKIYTVDEYRGMRMTVLEMLELLIPFSRASFYIASKDSNHLLADPVGIGIDEPELIQYIDRYESQDYTRWIFMSGKSTVYRETDLFSDDIRNKKVYFKEIYLRSNIYYSAQMSIGYSGDFLGIISLYRDKNSGNFSDKELFILNLIKNHLENRMNKEMDREKENGIKIQNKVYFDAQKFENQYNLTSREIEVLGLLFAGMSTEMINDTLAISNNTLKKHIMSIYKKLGINSRWELINFL